MTTETLRFATETPAIQDVCWLVHCSGFLLFAKQRVR